MADKTENSSIDMEGFSAQDEVDAILKHIQQRKEQASVVVNKTDKPHSMQFRLGGPGSEVKLYFETVEDLKAMVKELSEDQDLRMYIYAAKEKYAEQAK